MFYPGTVHTILYACACICVRDTRGRGMISNLRLTNFRWCMCIQCILCIHWLHKESELISPPKCLDQIVDRMQCYRGNDLQRDKVMGIHVQDQAQTRSNFLTKSVSLFQSEPNEREWNLIGFQLFTTHLLYPMPVKIFNINIRHSSLQATSIRSKCTFGLGWYALPA